MRTLRRSLRRAPVVAALLSLTLSLFGAEVRVWPEQATSDSAVKSASHGRSAVSASAALPVLSRVPSLADPESPLRWFKAPASVPTLTTNRVRQLRTGERLVACEAVAPESGPPRAVG